MTGLHCDVHLKSFMAQKQQGGPHTCTSQHLLRRDTCRWEAQHLPAQDGMHDVSCKSICVNDTVICFSAYILLGQNTSSKMDVDEDVADMPVSEIVASAKEHATVLAMLQAPPEAAAELVKVKDKFEITKEASSAKDGHAHAASASDAQDACHKIDDIAKKDIDMTKEDKDESAPVKPLVLPQQEAKTCEPPQVIEAKDRTIETNMPDDKNAKVPRQESANAGASPVAVVTAPLPLSTVFSGAASSGSALGPPVHPPGFEPAPNAQSASEGDAQAALLIQPGEDRISTEHKFLDFAKSYHWIGLARMLQEDPTLINASANGLRWTALHQATRASEPDVVEFLLSRRADFSATNREGQRPMDLATHKGIRRLLALSENGSLKFSDIEMPSSPTAVGGHLSQIDGGNETGYFWPPGFSYEQTYEAMRAAAAISGRPRLAPGRS